MNWHELDIGDRIKNVYSKYTLKDFWNWWSNGEDKVMEIRITDIPLIKEVSKKYNLQYSTSGVYVKNYLELARVVQFTREKAVIWFGCNPRKKNWSSSNKLDFKVYGSGRRVGSSDYNVLSMDFLPIDIDRKVKKGEATK